MIDEKNLIEELETMPYIHGRFDHVNGNIDFISGIETWHEIVLNKIQSQQKIGEWIPVSERLPNKDEYLKNDGRFIVTDGNRVYQSIYDIYSSHCFRTLVVYEYGSKANYEIDKDVIAWMPLPKAYKE